MRSASTWTTISAGDVVAGAKESWDAKGCGLGVFGRVLPVNVVEKRVADVFCGFAKDVEKELMDKRLNAIALLLYTLNMVEDYCRYYCEVSRNCVWSFNKKVQSERYKSSM